ncbi:UNVERIFIED_CONTAM: Pol polyprotein [Sesamum indicum]
MVKDRPAISETMEVEIVDQPCTWKEEIMLYLKEGILPDDPMQVRSLKFRATRFTMIGSDLYKRSVEGPLLKCLNHEQAKYVMREIHEGSCGNHSGARSLVQKVARQGYFWPTIAKDAKELVRKSKAQRKFIVVAVEYFSKWVEAEAVARISGKDMINFIWRNISCRFGVPRVLISDNGTQFQGKEITNWLRELKIRQNFTSVGYPQSNGQTEVTNRTILQHLKARIRSKGSWDEELPGVLWVYRTTPRSSIGESPFCLVYGFEVVIPAKIGEETQRIANYDPEANNKARAFDLTMVEEKRDAGYAKILHHKGLMMRNYNKRLRPREFQKSNLVLKKVEVLKYVGKLDPKWEGPFKVIEIKRKGTYILQDTKGRNLPRPWDIQNLRKFYHRRMPEKGRIM